jgi:CubicO group peptidase (beta-lactamase class C family)
VTVRQLLTHTGGFLGDADEPPDRGDDAVAKAVASYGGLVQLHRPGSLFSYSNAGYNVLGRLVECLAGTTWDEALRQRITAPLGLSHTFSLPERAMVHRVAVGHERLAGADSLTPVEEWLDPRSSGPCGGTLCMRAADLLAFARMHLRDGAGPDGRAVLDPAQARLMRQPQVTMTDPVFGDAWGLGWEIPRTAEPAVIGHGGHTNGQLSQLYLVPDRGVAMCVLTNGDHTGQLRERLCDEMLEAIAGVTLAHKPVPAPAGTAVELAPFLGTFGRDEIRMSFRRVDGGLEIQCFTSGEIARSVADFTAPLGYTAGSTFLLPVPGLEDYPTPITFIREDGGAGPATHLAVGGRVLPRLVDSGPTKLAGS